MYTAISILIIIVSILLTIVVLVQNSKGGGLAANFASGNQTFGVRQTADFLEKATWTLAAVLIGLVVMGGIKGIAKVTTILTPTMCALYIVSGLIVIFANFTSIPSALALIIKEAFSPKAMAGGAFACLLWGFRRAMFANESGLGTAPIAFSAVNTNKPVAQAFISMLQPFVDTVIVGVATAFVIVVSKAYLTVDGIAGIELTSKAFATICPAYPILLTIMASCFVLSTMLCGSYYGLKAWGFLFGEGKAKTRTFQAIYCLCIIAGSAMNFQSIINLSDAVTLFLAVPNLIAVFMLSNIVIKELKRYSDKYNDDYNSDSEKDLDAFYGNDKRYEVMHNLYLNLRNYNEEIDKYYVT